MADAEVPALHEAAGTLSRQAAAVLPVVTEVSSSEQVEALRDQAVTVQRTCWVTMSAWATRPTRCGWSSRGDREWVLEVNSGGVISGLGTRPCYRWNRTPGTS
jgi:hypothetical protein